MSPRLDGSDLALQAISSADEPTVRPLFSIITVNLNDAAGLRATAESVVGQSHGGHEWLVIDGGSSDGSREVIREFEGRIDAWSSAPDRGVYDAMNQGLRQARGDYLIFMNAGDRFADPAALGWLAACVQGMPEIDLVLGGTILELPSGGRVYRRPRPPATSLRRGLPAYHQATLIRRMAHLLVPYDLDLRVSADYGAIATLISRGAHSRCLDRPVAIRRCDPAGLSERETRVRFADFTRVQREILAKGWPEIAVNLGRLALVHFAYRVTVSCCSQPFMGQLMSLLQRNISTY
jgi:putative colanic acid biosynthesis glycosyltransferase